MGRIVKAKELQPQKTVALARWLLGKHLVRRHPDGRVEARLIIETEAYDGERDRACHARAGRTPRTAVMYAAGGVWYVYLCYGIHEMLNLVVGPADWPAAVLIRGVAGAVGPGRVTRTLGIDRRLNGAAACDAASGLWLEDRGVVVPRGAVRSGPRVGVDYAGPVWAAKAWRFRLDAGCRALAPSPDLAGISPKPRSQDGARNLPGSCQDHPGINEAGTNPAGHSPPAPAPLRAGPARPAPPEGAAPARPGRAGPKSPGRSVRRAGDTSPRTRLPGG